MGPEFVIEFMNSLKKGVYLLPSDLDSDIRDQLIQFGFILEDRTEENGFVVIKSLPANWWTRLVSGVSGIALMFYDTNGHRRCSYYIESRAIFIESRFEFVYKVRLCPSAQIFDMKKRCAVWSCVDLSFDKSWELAQGWLDINFPDWKDLKADW